jgi:hypothetical protein
MKKSAALLLVLLVAGCDMTSGNPLEEKMRADALSRASSDCAAARSCKVSMTQNGSDWVVTVSPTAIGMAGDPQFNSGSVHHYQYDASGAFVAETPD